MRSVEPDHYDQLPESVKKDISEKTGNNTGLPDTLKSGIATLSGYDLSDVRVHYNSTKPAAIQTHTYSQGSDIHIAPGQEKHLAHEAWHVVQQRQGRVSSKGIGNMNDSTLEKEADVMGGKAALLGSKA